MLLGYFEVVSLKIIVMFVATDGDTLCFIDFRADRMRQINEAMGIKPPFDTDVIPRDIVSLLISLTATETLPNWCKSCTFDCHLW